MKLGLQSAILQDKTFREAVDICAAIGFEALEVMCWPKSKATRRYGGVTHLDIQALTPVQLSGELDYAAQNGIEISALGYYPNPMSVDMTEREVAIAQIKRLIDVAAETNIGMVTGFIGRDRSKSTEANLILYKEIWSPLIEQAEKRNVRIAIENCPMLFTQDEWPGGNNLACTPAIWQEMFRLIDSKLLGLNYDPSHQVIQDMDYCQPLYAFTERIFHVHFKDTKIYRDKLNNCGRLAYPLQYMAPKLPGLGDIDWGRFCSALYDIHFDGYACIEMEDRAFEDTEALVLRGIQLAYQTMRQYL